MKILFVGESWRGSCARGLKEALSRNSEVDLNELAEDLYFPKSRSQLLRALNRLLRPVYRRVFSKDIIKKVQSSKPDVLMTYKGYPVHADLIKRVSNMGVMTVNVYPDYSPHAYGPVHRRAVGAYDLVISTKEYHPDLWSDLYRYQNRCQFVPQGYDPTVHLKGEAPETYEYDVVMVATYRDEYGKLIIDLSNALYKTKLRVAIGGSGWDVLAGQLPSHWFFPGAVHGDSYVSLLRSGKICIAPLTRNVVINGVRQPGDVDTTRSYELAASYCFFVHKRTNFALRLYGNAGVPMFDDAAELADHIEYFLDHDEERKKIAKEAHRIAVPAYSLDARARDITAVLNRALSNRDGESPNV